MRNVKNLLMHEFIGLKCSVVDASNKNQIGIKGKIVNETMKTLSIRENSEIIKNVEKKNSTFRVILNDKKILVEGNEIILRPEDRIKKQTRKW